MVVFPKWRTPPPPFGNPSFRKQLEWFCENWSSFFGWFKGIFKFPNNPMIFCEAVLEYQPSFFETIVTSSVEPYSLLAIVSIPRFPTKKSENSKIGNRKIGWDKWKSIICYRDFGKFGVDSELFYYSGCCNRPLVTQSPLGVQLDIWEVYSMGTAISIYLLICYIVQALVDNFPGKETNVFFWSGWPKKGFSLFSLKVRQDVNGLQLKGCHPLEVSL